MNIKKGELDESIEFIFDSHSKLVGLTTAEGEYFYVRDIPGNIIGLVDSYGEYVIKYKYNSWGKLLSKLPAEGDENFCLAARFNPFMYKGYYYDRETELYCLSSRYYSPELRIFIQPADVFSLNPTNINGLNLYSYLNNNPVNIGYSSLSTGMDSSLSFASSISCENIVVELSSLYTNTSAVNTPLKHISKVSDVFSAVSHSFIVGKYLFKNGKLHWLSYLDDMRMLGVNPTIGLFSLPKAKWINKIGYIVAIIDGAFTVYDNLQLGNTIGQALIDGTLSAGKSAVSAWVGGYIGANVGGMVGLYFGSLIPIPGVGSFIGFLVGTAVGIFVSWFVDDLLGLLKDGLLDLFYD